MKRKFIPTAEQAAAKLERREKFKILWSKVAKMSTNERVHIAHKLGLRNVAGHEMSCTNSILCMMQCPRVSIVGGFRQWIENGRAVKKGEHGMMIWFPIGRKTENESGEPSTLMDEKRFGIGTVFDISQTAPMAGQEAPIDVVTVSSDNRVDTGPLAIAQSAAAETVENFKLEIVN